MELGDRGGQAGSGRRLSCRGLVRLGLGGGAALTMAGCGSRSRPARNAAVTGQPRSGGTLTQGILNDPYDWDPSYAGAGSSVDYHLAYNTMLGWKHGPSVPYANSRSSRSWLRVGRFPTRRRSSSISGRV